MFWNSTGSDTREILLLYLLIYSDNPLAQILGISPCSMQEYALKVCWLRYSGNPPAVCMHILWHLTGSDTREILLLLYAGICFKSMLAQILGKSCCCMQVYILKIIWLRYSGNPAAVWINIFWHSTGSDTRWTPPVYGGIYTDASLAQIHGTCLLRCMQEYALKVCWLRYSGNPAAACRNMLWKYTGSDTREILLLYGIIYSDTSLAQILGKSCCCMYKCMLKIHWVIYSGNVSSAVCKNML